MLVAAAHVVYLDRSGTLCCGESGRVAVLGRGAYNAL
jgi:hypothetical protein